MKSVVSVAVNGPLEIAAACMQDLMHLPKTVPNQLVIRYIYARSSPKCS